MFVESSDIIISTISHSGQYVVIAKHCVKRVHIRSYFGRHFHAFRLNTERYGVSLRIQSEYRKMRTRNNSVFGHFSRSIYRQTKFFTLLYMRMRYLIFWPVFIHDMKKAAFNFFLSCENKGGVKCYYFS